MASRKKYLEVESQCEMDTCVILGSTSSTLIIRQNGLDEHYPSFEYKRNKHGEITGRGDDVFVHAEDVFSLTTWSGGDVKKKSEPRNFLKYTGYNESNFISLTDWEDKLTDEYYTFLTQHYTDRYANLDGKGKEWLYKVVRLAVKYHIMRNKVAGYIMALTTGVMEEDYICNPFAVFCYQILQTVKLSGSDVARKVNHIVKNRPEIEALEEQIKELEEDPEVSYKQSELHALKMQLKTMKEADKNYRQQLISEFINAHFKKIVEVVRIIAKIAGISEFLQLSEDLGHWDEGESDDDGESPATV